jgi:hypothetical protein
MFTMLVLGVLLLREARVAPIAGIEEGFINWLAANGATQHTTPPVTLIEINDDSLINYPYPWSPLNYALFLNAALSFHARVAAIEPILAWDASKLSPEELNEQPQFEKILHDSILRTPKLTLGAQLGYPDDPDVIPPYHPMPVLANVTGATDAVPEYTVVQDEPEEALRLTTPLGFTNVPPSEPTARHAPMVFRYRGNIVPSFALESMILWYGITPEDVTVDLGSEIRLGTALSIPINQAGAMLVDWEQPFDRVGFDDLVLAEDQLDSKHPPIVDPAILKDRLLVLARTDVKSLSLLFPTGHMGSPGELFAETIATAESQSFAKPAGQAGGALVIALGLWLAWELSRRGKLAVPVVIGAFSAAYLLLCLGVFETTRVALPLIPMFGLALFSAAYRLLAPPKSQKAP